jgi:hypothetical protein
VCLYDDLHLALILLRVFILDRLVLDSAPFLNLCSIDLLRIQLMRSGLCDGEVDQFTLGCRSVHGTARSSLPTLQKCKGRGEIYMT